jgi:cell division cycle protein 20 (cofactor of APC complex)
MEYQSPMSSPKTPKSQRTNASGSKTSKTPRSGKTPNKGDRFIPSRSAMDLEVGRYNLMKENVPVSNHADPSSPSRDSEYKEKLADTFFDGKMNGTKILAFKNKAPVSKEGVQNPHRVLYTANNSSLIKKATSRHIPQSAEKILDVPDIQNDYYLNLMDWSANVLSIALNNKVYLWNASTAEITELCETDINNSITSVKWTKEGRHLALGLNDGSVELWDPEASRRLRTMRGHSARVGVMSWNSWNLSTGSRDSNIHNYDVRTAAPLVSRFSGHTQEVCGLTWSDDGTQLASGGNDNVVHIWNVNNISGLADSHMEPAFKLTDHCAAVKALAWCPFQKDLLASGGGTADRHIR